MKNKIKSLFIFTIILVFGFTMTACDSPPDIDMVWIEGGTFLMGSPESETEHMEEAWFNFERPRRQITLSGFYMSKYLITQEVYNKVMKINPSFHTAANGQVRALGETDALRPVETVSWYEAIEFCNALSEMKGLKPFYIIDKTYGSDVNNNMEHDIQKWLVTTDISANGYRLPTEAQWEYACRAGSSTMWFFGDNADVIGEYAWFNGNEGDKTRQVGLKRPNPWGLFDIHGNVWEWCYDWYAPYTGDNLTDPTGPNSGIGRTSRGGAFMNESQHMRSAIRGSFFPSSTMYNIGFRVVLPKAAL
ncbi:MAG: formylglycine-generating enzyme family protein [Treponema sp.]|nr:formylglycine-generating enzyme family protein [Treponema sp.]